MMAPNAEVLAADVLLCEWAHREHLAGAEYEHCSRHVSDMKTIWECGTVPGVEGDVSIQRFGVAAVRDFEVHWEELRGFNMEECADKACFGHDLDRSLGRSLSDIEAGS